MNFLSPWVAAGLAAVVVPALVRSHPQHARCLPWIGRVHQGEIDLVLAAHGLVLVYAVLTSLPVRPRISPRSARRLIEEYRLLPAPEGLATVVALDTPDYTAVLESAAQNGVAGGAVYDALIAKAADLAGVDHLVTLNPKDFRRVWPEGEERIREP